MSKAMESAKRLKEYCSAKKNLVKTVNLMGGLTRKSAFIVFYEISLVFGYCLRMNINKLNNVKICF